MHIPHPALLKRGKERAKKRRGRIGKDKKWKKREMGGKGMKEGDGKKKEEPRKKRKKRGWERAKKEKGAGCQGKGKGEKRKRSGKGRDIPQNC